MNTFRHNQMNTRFVQLLCRAPTTHEWGKLHEHRLDILHCWVQTSIRRLRILDGNTYNWWILDISHYLSLSFENKLQSALSRDCDDTVLYDHEDQPPVSQENDQQVLPWSMFRSLGHEEYERTGPWTRRHSSPKPNRYF
mgnify:CR=1 FL=1